MNDLEEGLRKISADIIEIMQNLHAAVLHMENVHGCTHTDNLREIIGGPKVHESWEEYMSREGWKYMGSASDDA